MKNRKWYPYGCTYLWEIYRNCFQGWKFKFLCSYRNNRSWFVHECELYIDDSYYPVYSTKRQYYNRTWERRCYESVIQDAFIEYIMSQGRWFIEENKNDIKKIARDLDLKYYFKFLDEKLKEDE